MGQLMNAFLAGLALAATIHYGLTWIDKQGLESLAAYHEKNSGEELQKAEEKKPPKAYFEIIYRTESDTWSFRFQNHNQGTNINPKKLSYNIQTPDSRFSSQGFMPSKHAASAQSVIEQMLAQYSTITNLETIARE